MEATGSEILSVPLANLSLTRYATGLAVVPGNASGTAGPDLAVVASIKDFCIPKVGPSEVRWQGDGDGRKGFLRGQVQFQRAESEESLSHYNVYWKSEEHQLLGKVEATGFMKPKCEGDCDLLLAVKAPKKPGSDVRHRNWPCQVVRPFKSV